jgi:hypothetical protein
VDLTKVYHDQGGLSGNILQIVKREPEWAANRIQVGERVLAMLTEDQRRAAESGELAQQHLTGDKSKPADITPCSYREKCVDYIGGHCTGSEGTCGITA